MYNDPKRELTTRTCGWCLRCVGAWLRLEPGNPGPAWLLEPIEVCATCWRKVRSAYREELRRGLVLELVFDGSAALPEDLRQQADVPEAGALSSTWLRERAERRLVTSHRGFTAR